MGHSFRSCLTVGVATITAATIAFVPSVNEPAPVASPPQVVKVESPPIQLTAQVEPLATATSLPGLLVEWLQRIVVPPSAGQPFPTPQFPPVVAPTSIGSSIIWVYNAIEPWTRWVADVAAYAVGWIPYVGWLAPQITIFYNFGERIARSITYNIANWLDGNVSFIQGLVNVGVDTINSFIFLANDELAFWLPPLPPIPPLPGIILPFRATEATAAVTTAAAVTEDVVTESEMSIDAQVDEKHSAITGEVLGEETVANADRTPAITDEITANGEEQAEAEVLGEETVANADATPVTTDEITAKGQEEAEVDAVTEAKTTKTTGVAAQGEVRRAPNENEKTTESAKVANEDKKGETGERRRAAGRATEPSNTATSNDDTGTKRDNKDDTSKKDTNE
jgi:hypothetical protein